jgi:hypothetical protein
MRAGTNHELSADCVRSILGQVCQEKLRQQKPRAAPDTLLLTRSLRFLVQLLKRTFPLEPDFGPVAEVHFEARDAGQILDDLLLILKRGTEATRCAISVKSNRQLSKAGFNDEFVRDA